MFLINKVVSRKDSLKDIFIYEGLEPNAKFTFFQKPVDINKTVIDLFPTNMIKLTDVELIIETSQLNLEKKVKEIYYESLLKPYGKPFRELIYSPSESMVCLQKFHPNTLKYFGLNCFSSRDSNHCNGPEELCISWDIIREMELEIFGK